MSGRAATSCSVKRRTRYDLPIPRLPQTSTVPASPGRTRLERVRSRRTLSATNAAGPPSAAACSAGFPRERTASSAPGLRAGSKWRSIHRARSDPRGSFSDGRGATVRATACRGGSGEARHDGHCTREHLVQHDSDRIDVRCRANLLRSSLLGRHIRRRSNYPRHCGAE